MKPLLILFSLLALLLTGCSGLNAGELFCLPRAPEEYYDLQEALSEVLAQDLEYQAPAFGSRREPVQLVDLDGDRVDEAVAFLRNTRDGSVKTYIFSNKSGEFAPAAVIDCAGTVVGSVDYTDMDGDGIPELLMGCQVSQTVPQALQICRYLGDRAETLATVACGRYGLFKLDDSGKKALLCFSDDGGDGCLLGHYTLEDGAVTLKSQLRLKADYSGILEIRSGTLAQGASGVFVTSRREDQTVYDVLTLGDSGLASLEPEEGILISPTPANQILYPRDMDGDGLPEIPRVEIMPAYDEGATPQSMVLWYQLDSSGGAALKALTYHDFYDGWYLTLPEAWQDAVLAKNTDTASSDGAITATAFYRRTAEDKPGEEILTVFALRGDIRQSYPEEMGLSILRSDTETVYAVAIHDQAQPWAGTMTIAQVSEGFHLSEPETSK